MNGDSFKYHDQCQKIKDIFQVQVLNGFFVANISCIIYLANLIWSRKLAILQYY